MARSAGMFDTSLWVLLAVCLLLAALAYARGGAPLVQQGLAGGGRMILRYALVIAVSFLAAGFAELLLPQPVDARVARRDRRAARHPARHRPGHAHAGRPLRRDADRGRDAARGSGQRAR